MKVGKRHTSYIDRPGSVVENSVSCGPQRFSGTFHNRLFVYSNRMPWEVVVKTFWVLDWAGKKVSMKEISHN